MNIVAFILWLTCLLGYSPSESEIANEIEKQNRPIEIVEADPTGI